MGFLQGHFYHYFMKPRLFDPFFCPDHKYFKQIQSEHRWRAFYISTVVAILLVAKIAGTYLYVEHYVTIPEAWVNQMKSICPFMKKVHWLHNSAIALSGYYFILPMCYFWMAFSNSKFGSKFYPALDGVSDRIGLVEVLVRIAIVVLFERLHNKILPIVIFGTTDLEIFDDFIVKRVVHTVLFSALQLSPIENYMRLVFRKRCQDF